MKMKIFRIKSRFSLLIIWQIIHEMKLNIYGYCWRCCLMSLFLPEKTAKIVKNRKRKVSISLSDDISWKLKKVLSFCVICDLHFSKLSETYVKVRKPLTNPAKQVQLQHHRAIWKKVLRSMLSASWISPFIQRFISYFSLTLILLVLLPLLCFIASFSSGGRRRGEIL